MWDILDFSSAVRVDTEPAGAREKVWLRWNKEQWLFKDQRTNSNEVMAEVIASALAHRLGLPHVAYHRANFDGKVGCVCKKVDGLKHGQLLLATQVKEGSSIRYKNFAHSVKAVHDALINLDPPRASDGIEISSHCAQMSALGVYTGYLLLDAWIANTDRHSENWGYVDGVAGQVACLAPTYDHGSAFSWREADEKLDQRLRTKDQGTSASTFLSRAKSALYLETSEAKSNKTIGTVAAYREFAKMEPCAANIWKKYLSKADTDNFIDTLVTSIPSDALSVVRGRWLRTVLKHNASAILGSG